MPKVSIAVIAIISLLVGYMLGNFVPLRNFSSTNQPSTNSSKNNNTTIVPIPSGKGVLEVTVKNSSNAPMVGIETDIGLQPGGLPESWGIKEADVNGTTNFKLDPGTYYIYFNLSHFPSGYKNPTPQKVIVQDGQTKSVAITLESN